MQAQQNPKSVETPILKKPHQPIKKPYNKEATYWKTS